MFLRAVCRLEVSRDSEAQECVGVVTGRKCQGQLLLRCLFRHHDEVDMDVRLFGHVCREFIGVEILDARSLDDHDVYGDRSCDDGVGAVRGIFHLCHLLLRTLCRQNRCDHQRDDDQSDDSFHKNLHLFLSGKAPQPFTEPTRTPFTKKRCTKG